MTSRWANKSEVLQPTSQTSKKVEGNHDRSASCHLMERASVLTHVLRYECWQPPRAELCPGWDFPRRTAAAATETPAEVPQRRKSLLKHDKQFYCAGLPGDIWRHLLSLLLPSPPKNECMVEMDHNPTNTQTGIPMLYDSKTVLHHTKESVRYYSTVRAASSLSRYWKG